LETNINFYETSLGNVFQQAFGKLFGTGFINDYCDNKCKTLSITDFSACTNSRWTYFTKVAYM